MKDKETVGEDGRGINRRTVLKSAAAASAAGLVGVPAFSGSVAATSHETYLLSQGGTDYSVTAVTYTDSDGNLVPIEDFYNYASAGNLGGSNTPLGIEQNNQSRMFLYRGPAGLYAVFLHDDKWADGPTDEKDWQAYFEFTGLPSDGSWVINEGNDPTDDFGDVDQFYWRWYPKWSDGGAYGLLSCEPGKEFSIDVTPDFNPNPDGTTFPEAPQSEVWLDTDGWKFYDGTGDLITLDTTASLTIACETCPECTTDDLLEKWEFVETDDGGCKFQRENHKGDDPNIGEVVRSTNKKDDGEEEECEPVSVTFETDYCSGTLDAVVKAGSETITLKDLNVSDGEVTVTNGGVKYAISNIRFYCEAPEDTTLGHSDEEEDEEE